MVDADQRRRALAEPIDQPFFDTAPGPMLSGRRWREVGHIRSNTLGHIGRQARQTGARRFRARVVNADLAGEPGQKCSRSLQLPDFRRRGSASVDTQRDGCQGHGVSAGTCTTGPSYVLSLLLPLEWKRGRGRGYLGLMQLTDHLSRFEDGFNRILGERCGLHIDKAALKSVNYLGVDRSSVRLCGLDQSGL